MKRNKFLDWLLPALYRKGGKDLKKLQAVVWLVIKTENDK